jgi:uncharacterized protein (TIGR02611 family)
MGLRTALMGWFRRTGSEILGWTIVVVGIILMPLPGPGMLIVASGLAVLSRNYVWAQKLLEPIERKATEAAKFSVATWPRVFLSFLGGVWLAALGVIWWVSPKIPEFEVFSLGIAPTLLRVAWVGLHILVVVAVVAGAIRAVQAKRVPVAVGIVVAGLALIALATWWSPGLAHVELTVAFGPRLPAHGWATALGLWASAFAAWGLLAYSVVRWREPQMAAHSNA